MPYTIQFEEVKLNSLIVNKLITLLWKVQGKTNFIY